MIRFFCVLCSLAVVASCAGTPRTNPQASPPRASWQRPDVGLEEIATPEELGACLKQDHAACYRLAWHLDALEHPSPAQERAAFDLHIESCMLGPGPACDRIAHHYLFSKHDVVVPDVALAREAMEASCLRGEGSDCHVVGYLYTDGEHMPRDPGEGLSWLEKGCEVNYFPSCSVAGLMHHSGRGTLPSVRTAARFYEKGCAGGETSVSCLNLSLFLFSGALGEVDEARGEALMRRCCHGGNEECCKNMRLLEASP